MLKLMQCKPLSQFEDVSPVFWTWTFFFFFSLGATSTKAESNEWLSLVSGHSLTVSNCSSIQTDKQTTVTRPDKSKLIHTFCDDAGVLLLTSTYVEWEVDSHCWLCQFSTIGIAWLPPAHLGLTHPFKAVFAPSFPKLSPRYCCCFCYGSKSPFEKKKKENPFCICTMYVVSNGSFMSVWDKKFAQASLSQRSCPWVSKVRTSC